MEVSSKSKMVQKKVSFHSNPKERQCQRMLKLPDKFHSSHMLVGEGNGTPPQYSCLENPMDGGAWKAARAPIVYVSDV